jgi:hypothetical protein
MIKKSAEVNTSTDFYLVKAKHKRAALPGGRLFSVVFFASNQNGVPSLFGRSAATEATAAAESVDMPFAP